jgi:hypothetical protein
MRIVAVLLQGSKHYEYFEVDGWQSDKGLLTLIRGGRSVAAFPFENLSGVVDVTSDAAVSDDNLKEKLEASKKTAKPVNVALLSRKRPESP